MAAIELPDVMFFADGQELCAADLNNALLSLTEWVCDNFSSTDTEVTGTSNECLTVPASCGGGENEAVSGAYLASVLENLDEAKCCGHGERGEYAADTAGCFTVQVPVGTFTGGITSATAVAEGAVCIFVLDSINGNDVVFKAYDANGNVKTNQMIDASVTIIGVP